MERKVKITVLPDEQVITASVGETILSALARANRLILASCGGKGTCGKCKVQLLQGAVDNAVVDEKGFVLSCRAILKGNVTIKFLEQSGSGLTNFNEVKVSGDKTGLGVALDIGTTTLGACLINLETGETIKKISSLNPQGVCGADVLSRINACSEGKLALLKELIISETKRLICELAPNKDIELLYVGANTTMLHLFLGIDPTPIGSYPFTPVFTCEKNLTGEELGLPVKKVKLLPSASAYIGSDVTAGALTCLSVENGASNAIFVDIGTNGEIALSYNGVIYATSTAAGPALEGACIECGLGGVNGAIDRFFVENDQILFTTINGEKAKGICGSGLIDIIAFLKEEEIIDESGTFDEFSESRFINNLKEDRFYITDEIYISQKDIRQFQLAKAAISAGIETLMIEKEVDHTSIDKLFIAGGLGYFMNVENACSVGLLPKILQSKAVPVGNTCLSGIKLCLLREENVEKIKEIASAMQIVELSFSKVFQDKYVENMLF